MSENSNTNVKRTGFFSFIKAVNRISNELLVIGKDYATKFKDGNITAQEYEYEMVGKIYELTNRFSGGNDELEKDIKTKFSDICAKYLKEGIELYVESLQTDGSLTQKVKDEPNINIPNKQNDNSVNNYHNDVTSSKKLDTNVNTKSLESDVVLDKLLNEILGIVGE